MLPTKFRFIWPSGSEERIFLNQPIRNKNFLWQPCLLTDREEMCNLYTGPCINASYQVSGHLVKRIRTKCAILIEDLPQMLPTKFHFIWRSSFRGED
jgi:hypothetical protein